MLELTDIATSVYRFRLKSRNCAIQQNEELFVYRKEK